VTVYGTTVRVALPDGVAPDGLVHALVQAGLTAHAEPTEPTLDDAFAALLPRTEGRVA
jgi:hypothetical protein